MTRGRVLVIIAVILVGMLVLVAFCTAATSNPPRGPLQPYPTAPTRTGTAVPAGPAASPTAVSTGIPTGVDSGPVPAVCKLGPERRPDPVCNPGATNPKVTQDTIMSTICVAGWTTKIRPSTAYTNALKVRQIKAYGYLDVRLTSYEEDHLLPLGMGGHPRDPRNLWPELRRAAGGNAEDKDKAEQAGQRDICAGRLTLAEAQRKHLAAWGPMG